MVEALAIERIRIKGTKDIMFDPVPGMKLSDQKPGKVLYFSRSSPQHTFEILSFHSKAFPAEVNASTLQLYLQGRAIDLAKKNFEIIEAPVVTTGPAKFRILGERALTLRYAFDTEQGRIIRGENWLEKDGMVHVVAIQGTPNGFNRHFKRVKAALNSMTYLERPGER